MATLGSWPARSAVLILLPPSEAKAAGGTGASLRAAGLSRPGPYGLGGARRQVLETVSALCRSDPVAATSTLRLPGGTATEDLAANIAMLDAPTMPALDRFTGVIYLAMDAAGLTARQRRAALASVHIFSGAFGLLRADEPVPLHRVPAAAAIPPIGGLTAYWRAHLREAAPSLFAPGSLLVDLRSTDYAALWQVTGPLRASVTPVRVLVERRVGRKWVRRTLSYQSKLGKGLLARELIVAAAAGHAARTPADVAAAGERVGYVAEPRTLPGQTGVDLVIRA